MEINGTINNTDVQSILLFIKKLPLVRIKRGYDVNFKENNSVDHYGHIRTE